MDSWVTKAKTAYNQRNIDRQNEEAKKQGAEHERLAKLVSEIMGEEYPVSGDVIVLADPNTPISLTFAEPNAALPSVIMRCRLCDDEYYIPVTSLADLGELATFGARKFPHKDCLNKSNPANLQPSVFL